ncbi:Ubiquitin domain-containing protein DSK2b [Carex littledalei]|uniref:Ubiquitin domain-containing protein DSK2b n=1 Tax=Carex littledalei TaxID=544730 RepID=A0A833QLM3_9POAL|nr:Ubiquitin domain-containing protein DSK2b [Carex littledalei]
MGSSGEGSHHESSPVTLQIQLMDRSKISVQTNIDQTVEEFKLVLADLTCVPSDEQWLVHTGRILRNPQTLRSYGLFLFWLHTFIIDLLVDRAFAELIEADNISQDMYDSAFNILDGVTRHIEVVVPEELFASRLVFLFLLLFSSFLSVGYAERNYDSFFLFEDPIDLQGGLPTITMGATTHMPGIGTGYDGSCNHVQSLLYSLSGPYSGKDFAVRLNQSRLQFKSFAQTFLSLLTMGSDGESTDDEFTVGSDGASTDDEFTMGSDGESIDEECTILIQWADRSKISMGSDGETTEDEPVSLQIQLPDGSEISVATELDITVEEFKLWLANRTGIPANEFKLVYNETILRNPQTIRNCVLDPDKVIRLICCSTPQSNTSIVSMSSPSTPRSPRETCKLDAANRSFKKPQSQLLDKHLYCTANIIERIPSLRQMEDTVGIKYILQYLFHVEIQRRMASLKAIITEIIKALTSMASQHGISFGREENLLSLCLSHLNLVGTSGSGPESLNTNRSECAPNSNPLPNPCAFNSYRATTWPLIDYEETIDKIMLLLLSDATLLRHCMEVKLLTVSRINPTMYPCFVTAAALDAYFGPIERKILALQNGGSDDFALKAAVSEELFASQLAQMEEMGFMDRRENIKALLNSGGDVQKAVKRLLEKPNLDEGR